MRFNCRDRGLQGYLRLSLSVLGPDDKPYVPDDTEDGVGSTDSGREGDGANNETDAQALALLPPSISQACADNLP